MRTNVSGEEKTNNKGNNTASSEVNRIENRVVLFAVVGFVYSFPSPPNNAFVASVRTEKQQTTLANWYVSQIGCF